MCSDTLKRNREAGRDLDEKEHKFHYKLYKLNL